MKKLDILIDMDGIIVDLQSHIINRYNDTFDADITIEHINQWDYEKSLEHGAHVSRWFQEPGFFYSARPISGAIHTLNRLFCEGHNLYIVSAPAGPHSAHDKLKWLSEQLPFIPRKNIFLGHHKHMIKGDVFIDDSPTNLKAYKEHHPHALTLSIKYPYNEYKDADYTATDCHSPEGAWQQIFAAIKIFSQSLKSNEG